MFGQLIRVELNLSVIPYRYEVFVQTVFLMGLEPVVVNEVFREAVVVDDVAFRTDTEESTSGDIDVTQDCWDVQQSACAVDAVSGVRKRLRSQGEAAGPSAYIRAALTIRSAGTPVMASVFSGVKSLQ